MGRQILRLPDMVVSPGNVDSNVLTARGLPTAPNQATDGFGYRDADDIIIEAPADLIEVANFMVAADESNPRWSQMQDQNQNPVVLKQGQATRLDSVAFGAMKITIPGGVAAPRVFQVSKTLDF